jgi:hypothetical protein
MTDDPIVAEVRAVREQMFKECDYDLGKLVRYLHRQRKKLELKAVRRKPTHTARPGRSRAHA